MAPLLLSRRWAKDLGGHVDFEKNTIDFAAIGQKAQLTTRGGEQDGHYALEMRAPPPRAIVQTVFDWKTDD
eukprot:1964799-Pyramimonas_sp.AAC.1